MRILAINGSGRGMGNTDTLLKAMGAGLPDDVAFEVVRLKDYDYSGCVGCEGCAKTNRCVLKDDMQQIYEKIEEADGLILGSPTYFYNVSAKMKAFIDRLYCYDIFDPEDRSVWISTTEMHGLKYAAVVAICEQSDVKDMGFTAEAMARPLEAVGYRVVAMEKVLHLFKRDEAEAALDVQERMKRAGLKLYRTIKLARGLKIRKE